MGDRPGHPFRGNQYKHGGSPSLGDRVEHTERASRGTVVAIPVKGGGVYVREDSGVTKLHPTEKFRLVDERVGIKRALEEQRKAVGKSRVGLARGDWRKKPKSSHDIEIEERGW